ncbi:uncharacterized protein [Diadema antillarum]|uniref:uncharacterized protein n=1 Tax=Diadema antillarum TaxID=105358 RepID=UPI003A87B330
MIVAYLPCSQERRAKPDQKAKKHKEALAALVESVSNSRLRNNRHYVEETTPGPATSNEILQAIQVLQRKVDSTTRKSAKPESPSFKSEGNRQQFDHAQKVSQCVDDALHSLKDLDIEAAKERLLEASRLLAHRQKLIRLADRSSLGWATVKEYVTDDLVENSDNEKHLRKAEKAAAAKKAETAKKSRRQPLFRAPRSSLPPRLMPETFRRYIPYRPDTRVCFQCGIVGHVRPKLPLPSSRQKRRQPAPAFQGPLLVLTPPLRSTRLQACKKELVTDPHLRNLASDVLPSLMSAKASSTTSKYKSCWARWVQWAISKSEVPSFPVQAYHLCLYLCHLSSVNGAKTAADLLVASVKWAHNLAGLPSPTDDPMVKTTVQGYYRIHSFPVCRKEPVTPEILSNLLASHGHLNASLADLRILFVCFVSYAGFLRFDDLSRPRRKDCTTHHDRLVLHLSSSKTDQFRQGRDVPIASTSKPTCPDVIAERYFAAVGDPPHSPLPVIRRLTLSKGGLIATSHGLSYTRTREVVLEALKPFVPDVSKFGLHSLRSDGASSASNNRVPSFLISQHGRWKSDKARDSYIKSDALSNLLPSQSLGI